MCVYVYVSVDTSVVGLCLCLGVLVHMDVGGLCVCESICICMYVDLYIRGNVYLDQYLCLSV